MNLFKVVVASKLFKSLSAKSNLQTMVMKVKIPSEERIDYSEDSEKWHSRPQWINDLCGIWIVRLSSPHKKSISSEFLKLYYTTRNLPFMLYKIICFTIESTIFNRQCYLQLSVTRRFFKIKDMKTIKATDDGIHIAKFVSILKCQNDFPNH